MPELEPRSSKRWNGRNAELALIVGQAGAVVDDVETDPTVVAGARP